MIAIENTLVVSREELETLLRAAARMGAEEALRRRQGEEEPELWDAARIAAFLGVSKYTVAYKLAYERHFPEPIRIGSGNRAQRRWKASEVLAWAERRQGKAR